jgi:small conductance mechanosensitive channel
MDFLTSLKDFSQFFAIIAATMLSAYLFDRYFAKMLRKASGVLKSDPANYVFFRHFITALIYIIGISWAISEVPQLKTLYQSLLAGAGVLAVAVGFASQQALSNIISGLFIVIFKPFRVNDRLKIRETLSGVVEDITLRHTVIRDFENKRIIIPNSVIGQEVITNSDFMDDKIIKYVEINVAFDTNLEKAKEIMREEVMKHPLHIDPRSEEAKEKNEPEVTVRVVLIGSYFITIRAWACAKNASDAFVLYCDLLEQIKGRFDAEGIVIPYPYK